MMCMCRVFSCVVGRGCLLMTNAFSWQNSVSLWPASFCTPRPNLPVAPGISWLPTFESQSPMMKRTSFFVLVLEGLIVFHGTMDCSLPGSSVHGIFQARILEWVAITFSKGIFPTQGLNLGLQHCRSVLYHLSHQGSPRWPSGIQGEQDFYSNISL